VGVEATSPSVSDVIDPVYISNLIRRMRQFRTAHTVLEQFMRKAITERKEILRKRSENEAGDDDGYNDVLSMLVYAGETEGKLKLDDQELVRGAAIKKKRHSLGILSDFRRWGMFSECYLLDTVSRAHSPFLPVF
jgi:hypothetical protein